MIPVVGNVFDIVNAGISLARGNYVDAAINLAAALPGIGQMATGAKFAGATAAILGAVRLTDKASDAFKIAKGAPRVFWSGSREAKIAAEAFARQSGGTTLEMTLRGKVLDKITTKQTYPFLKPLWDRASANFAKGANGTVDVFQSSKGVRLESVWAKKEYPRLFQQGNPINYHITP